MILSRGQRLTKAERRADVKKKVALFFKGDEDWGIIKGRSGR